MLNKRYEYTSNNIQKKSLLINEILFKNFDFNKINIIHTFLPILQKKDKNIKIHGIDIDPHSLLVCNKRILKNNLENHVKVELISLALISFYSYYFCFTIF